MDFITLLHSAGRRMAKTWTPDGIRGYDRAKNYTAHYVTVRDTRDLGRALQHIETDPLKCVIRGLHRSWLDEQHPDPITGEVFLPVKTTRDLEQFVEVPHRWVCLDVDDFTSQHTEPLAQIDEFITTRLPVEFQGITYHYQLSNSYGKPGAEHQLKAHLWFWLDAPRGEAELTRWRHAVCQAVDVVTFRTVQVHYTAAPVFEGDAQDPVLPGQRSGLVEGILGDEVALQIPPATADERRPSDRRAMVDPASKPGIVGAFCEVVDIRQALAEHLGGHFEYEGDSDTRLTWLQGGGAAGGARITDDEAHVYNSHNTDPLYGGAANAFDLCRAHLFGHLDASLDYATVTGDPTLLPSHAAMVAYAMAVPGVREALSRRRRDSVDDFADLEDEDSHAVLPRTSALTSTTQPPTAPGEDHTSPSTSSREDVILRAIQKVQAQPDATALEEYVAGIADMDWSEGERERLARAAKARYTQLTGDAVPIATARRWLQPPRAAGLFPDLNEDGRVLGTYDNMVELLKRAGLGIRFNTITKEDEITGAGDYVMDAQNNARLATIISEVNRVDMKVNLSTVKLLLNKISAAGAYNPALDWVTSHPWDGVDRIQDLCDSVAVASEHADLRDKMIRRWLIQAVAILHNEGTMMARGVLVFQGRQNLGKTRWLASLAPIDWVGTGKAIDPHNKDTLLAALTKWLVELGEIDSTFKRADVAALKAFISGSVDEIRRPYAPVAERMPRRTAFFASVNADEFLSDPTGSTRFWVLPVLAVNPNHGINMQQVFAQALSLWRSGEQHWMTDDELQAVTDSNKGFEVLHPIEEEVDTRLDWNAPKDRWAWRTGTQICALLGVRNVTILDARRAAKRVGDLSGTPRRVSKGLSRYLCPPLVSVTDFEDS